MVHTHRLGDLELANGKQPERARSSFALNLATRILSRVDLVAASVARSLAALDTRDARARRAAEASPHDAPDDMGLALKVRAWSMKS